MKIALRRIDWFRARGYLLGQDKKKYYIVHPQNGRKDFDEIKDAEVYVENMIAFRRQRMSATRQGGNDVT